MKIVKYFSVALFLLTLSASCFPAYSQTSEKSIFSMLQAGCSRHNTESEAYRCYKKGIEAGLAEKSMPAIMREMCNVTRGKAKQEVHCYRSSVNATNNESLKNTVINVCGKNTNWGTELSCIVGAVEGAMK